mmetsp:Transcript_14108/g.37385  ORF Transcript_14108/g.37385 Transcript_14108/m.37385 type:complete len:216 (+) Transcript_14108:170-817(+)
MERSLKVFARHGLLVPGLHYLRLRSCIGLGISPEACLLELLVEGGAGTCRAPRLACCSNYEKNYRGCRKGEGRGGPGVRQVRDVRLHAFGRRRGRVLHQQHLERIRKPAEHLRAERRRCRRWLRLDRCLRVSGAADHEAHPLRIGNGAVHPALRLARDAHVPRGRYDVGDHDAARAVEFGPPVQMAAALVHGDGVAARLHVERVLGGCGRGLGVH